MEDYPVPSHESNVKPADIVAFEQDGLRYFPYPHPSARSGKKLVWVKLTEKWQAGIVTGYDVLDADPEREVAITQRCVVEVDSAMQRIVERIRDGVLEVTDGPKVAGGAKSKPADAPAASSSDAGK